MLKYLGPVAGVLISLSVRDAVAQREGVKLVEPPPGTLAAVDAATFEAHLRFLADDLLEGRAVGTRGAELAARYVATQFAAAGLRPAWPEGYLRRVPLIAATTDASLVVGAGRRTIVLQSGTDFVAWPTQPDSAVVLDADLVFGGYGIEAPEWRWRDFEAAAVSGKVLLVRPGEPGGADSALFRGRAATRYGRWAYKIEQAARAGAAGVLLIHSADAPPGPWNAVRASWQRETLQPERASLQGLRFAAWISADAARRLVEATGKDYDLLMRRAEGPGFSAIDLGARAAVDMRTRLRSLSSPNVVGVLEGSGVTSTDGAIVLVGHYDHLGIGPSVDGDSIYNGAVDNASGVAALLTLARALAASPRPPRRTVVFAATTASEHGMTGAAALAAAPPPASGPIVAAFGVHEMNVWGVTRDVVVLGAELSTLGDVMREAARLEQLESVADPSPEIGSLYDGDQLPFAVAGIPIVALKTGGRAESGGTGISELVARYRAEHRHQPSDQLFEGMSPAGAVVQMRVLLRAVWHSAAEQGSPTWLPGAEFGTVAGTSGPRR